MIRSESQKVKNETEKDQRATKNIGGDQREKDFLLPRGARLRLVCRVLWNGTLIDPLKIKTSGIITN